MDGGIYLESDILNSFHAFWPLYHYCARSKATDPDVFSMYFDLLEESMKENKLDVKPEEIFNIDDSNAP